MPSRMHGSSDSAPSREQNGAPSAGYLLFSWQRAELGRYQKSKGEFGPMPFDIIKRLGSGNFGIVELVSDQEGNQYARKTFSPSQPLGTDLEQNVRRRFVREATIQKGFSHKNIVPVLGAQLDGNSPYYL